MALMHRAFPYLGPRCIFRPVRQSSKNFERIKIKDKQTVQATDLLNFVIIKLK